jgi:hypothetical protein
LAAPGYWYNPALKKCWETCGACGRCNKKGTNACPEPNLCSGRYDPKGVIDPDRDDYCECKIGVLRWKTKEGKKIIVRYQTNPFQGRVVKENRTEDERDWDAFCRDQSERLGIENWNPITITSG